MKKLLILLLLPLFAFPQKVVDDFKDVKKPKHGKLYFSQKQNRLSIYTGTLFQTVTEVDSDTTKPIPPDKEAVVGYWSSPDRILVTYTIGENLWLMQRDLSGSYYIARGRNLLDDPRTELSGKVNKNTISGGDTDLGGLYSPSSFPESEFLKETARVKNANGEYVLPGTQEPEAGGGGNNDPPASAGILQSIPTYPLPDQTNLTIFEQFSDLKLPDGITNVGGYGFPLYKNEGLNNGKVDLFQKGFSNLVNLSALNRSTWEPKNSYGFNQLYYLIKVAAREMVKVGKLGPNYGDIAIIAGQENDNTNIPYYLLTVEGAKELGRYIFYTNCCSNSLDDLRYDIPLNEGAIMLDEESMTSYNWPGGDHYSFLGYLNQGITEAAGGKYRVFWYGQPAQRFFQNLENRGIENLQERDIEAAFSDGSTLMSSPGWRNSTWFVDANGAYSKVPFLSHTDIYEKVNGKIAIDKNGKRKFRTDNFSVHIYKTDFPILSEPHEWIKYAIQNGSTGEMRFGRQYVDIAPGGSATVKPEYVKQGFGWPASGLARPNPSQWDPESKLWVDGIYRRADGIMSDLLMLARLEKGKWDISGANVKYKLYGEHRPQTEPWTFGGNSTEVREVGESQIFYDTFMLLLSGGQALSSWDDGFFRTELPDKGQPLYGKDDYWGRYHSKLAAVQTVLKPLEGSKSTDWTYIHFYYPFWGRKNSEIISSGIYYQGKLYVFFLNPMLENGEKQAIKLTAGGKAFDLELTGHEVYYTTIEAGSGLSPKDFKLDYTTIYGRKVKVNGRVTNKISEHYN